MRFSTDYLTFAAMFEIVVIGFLVAIALAVFGLGAHFVTKVNAIHADVASALQAHGIALATIQGDTRTLVYSAKNVLTGDLAKKAQDDIAKAKADLVAAFEKVKAIVEPSPNNSATAVVVTAGVAPVANAPAVADTAITQAFGKPISSFVADPAPVVPPVGSSLTA